ncbi:MAG: hypothetical protein M9955_08145 [Rhizobiaceae bacterium]|jgi:hypothetical protein|nr:hypothetical protein [Rhizobiaceae bacterium]
MKKTFAILVASTALAIGAGVPAWSGMRRSEHASARTSDDGILKLASDDRLDRDHGRKARSGDDDDSYGHDDDDDHDDHDDDDDDGYSRNESANPAPAGAVAPPANGLFGSGPAPKVRLN